MDIKRIGTLCGDIGYRQSSASDRREGGEVTVSSYYPIVFLVDVDNIGISWGICSRNSGTATILVRSSVTVLNIRAMLSCYRYHLTSWATPFATRCSRPPLRC